MAVKEFHNETPTTVDGERKSPVTTNATVPMRIRSSVPSRRVLRIINPFVSVILRSPLHRLLSSQVLLLTYTGRKTEKRFTFPVFYTHEGDTLILFSSRSWWKNLRRGGNVAMHLQSRARTGRAEVIEERSAVLDAAEHLVAKYGLKEAGRRIGLALDISPPPTTDELAAAMEDRVVIRIILD
ncbi:MAG TPA: nitroreductase/quinone reductase family protein [Rubrobacter sp.]|nr:nitroreductase/quinone reductase family protein [Rubrobacter sp.]